MASLTITVPDAVVPRILKALQAKTAADVTAYIKTIIQQRVAGEEANMVTAQAQVTADQTKTNVLNEQW